MRCRFCRAPILSTKYLASIRARIAAGGRFRLVVHGFDARCTMPVRLDARRLCKIDEMNC
ncbi:hypothetical protein DF156_03300 [Burkholderia ubonensis]|uniref:Uncharacterized protein n=1 Tax=Burkholderia ubonensis TaxID=101571 RepID=A0AB74DBK5_9BURK|nr:hypothetical protein DF155_10600 [Burkholderia ubonensis]RQP43616.1 hypothetical protein DF154_08030 [Burkholderia ubonensis]RQP46403.1 hypothetical protein DF156_03300 [Burkholderia ubonensis]RQP59734.1 hypothetical protein DF144_04710 [Burkholderia ubonensis]RQP65795.1 hypothetical protein DF151_03275 [Burkholderia ubonensis]